MRLPFVLAVLFGLWLNVAAEGDRNLRGSPSADADLEQPSDTSILQQQHRQLLDCKGKDKHKQACKDKQKDEDDEDGSGDSASESKGSDSASLDSSSWSRSDSTDAKLADQNKKLKDKYDADLDSLDELIYNDAYSVLSPNQKKKLKKLYDTGKLKDDPYKDAVDIDNLPPVDVSPNQQQQRKRKKPKNETPEQKKKRKNQELEDLLSGIAEMEFRDGLKLLNPNNAADQKEIRRKMDMRAKKILARKWAEQMRFEDEDGKAISEPLLVNAVMNFQIKEFMKRSTDVGVDELKKRLMKDQGHKIKMVLKRKALSSLERKVQMDHWDMMDNQDSALDRAKKEKRKDKLLDQISKLDDVKVFKDKEGKVVTDPDKIKALKKEHTKAMIIREIVPKNIDFTDGQGNVRDMGQTDKKLLRSFQLRSMKKKIGRMMDAGKNLNEILDIVVPADPSKNFVRQDKLDLMMKGRPRTRSTYGAGLYRRQSSVRNRGYSQARPNPPALSRAQSVKRVGHNNKPKVKRGKSLKNALKRISNSFRSASKKWKKKTKEEKLESVVKWGERADNTKDIVSSGFDGTWSDMFDAGEPVFSAVFDLLSSLG